MKSDELRKSHRSNAIDASVVCFVDIKTRQTSMQKIGTVVGLSP